MKKNIMSGIAALMMVAGAVVFANSNTSKIATAICGDDCCTGSCSKAASAGISAVTLKENCGDGCCPCFK